MSVTGPVRDALVNSGAGMAAAGRRRRLPLIGAPGCAHVRPNVTARLSRQQRRCRNDDHGPPRGLPAWKVRLVAAVLRGGATETGDLGEPCRPGHSGRGRRPDRAAFTTACPRRRPPHPAPGPGPLELELYCPGFSVLVTYTRMNEYIIHQTTAREGGRVVATDGHPVSTSVPATMSTTPARAPLLMFMRRANKRRLGRLVRAREPLPVAADAGRVGELPWPPVGETLERRQVLPVQALAGA